MRSSFKKSFRSEPVVKYKYIIFQFSENRVFLIDQAFVAEHTMWTFAIVKFDIVKNGFLKFFYHFDRNLKFDLNKKTLIAPRQKCTLQFSKECIVSKLSFLASCGDWIQTLISTSFSKFPVSFLRTRKHTILHLDLFPRTIYPRVLCVNQIILYLRDTPDLFPRTVKNRITHLLSIS